MLGSLGWGIAALLFLVLCVIWWSWRKHAMESLAQSEFIAMLLLIPGLYEDRRKVYTAAIDEMPGDGIDIARIMGVSMRAKGLALAHIQSVGMPEGLAVALSDYRKGRAFWAKMRDEPNV